MPVPTLPRGSYLLLVPEDVDGVIVTPAYAKIKSSRGASATVALEVDNEETEKMEKIPRTKAITRKVTSTDAEGQLLGTWIRQAVCVKNDGFFRYGQVTGYSDSRLTISTLSGPIEESPDVICDTVYPVVMGCLQFEESSWDYEQLTRIHDTLMERLLSPPTSEVPQNALPLAELIQGLLPDVFPGFDRMAKWIDSHTGTEASQRPAHVKASFGTSFCDFVVTSRTTENAPSAQNTVQTNTSNASEFVNILRVDDENETTQEEALVANKHPQQTYSLPQAPNSDTSPASTSNAGPLTEAPTAEEEIRALIRMQKPHLLQYHLTAQPDPDSSLKRTATVDIGNSAAKRSKFSFHPSAEQ
ncbi:hypothetical protein F442_23165 [Phytophthora nicotianae P10297]|uniref:Uncharacterized protein n=1 Tax=Phytophthora nicotianae P10297 TaxID=1317064 RepID=W2XYE9_PHYNI|nr:hypothetical protein F442_23165 [Phytophthora nicotianae P10297]